MIFTTVPESPEGISIASVGLDVYPDPGDNMVMVVILLPLITGKRTAPAPPPPVIVIKGTVEYPNPGTFIVTDPIVPPVIPAVKEAVWGFISTKSPTLNVGRFIPLQEKFISSQVHLSISNSKTNGVPIGTMYGRFVEGSM